MTAATSHPRLREPLRPMYLDMAQRLLADIGRRRLTTGDRLGTEAEMGQSYGVSRVTVRRALSILSQQGYIVSYKRRGTFLRKPVEASVAVGGGAVTVLVVCAATEFIGRFENFALSRVLQALENELAGASRIVQLLIVGRDAVADRARLEQASASDHIESVVVIGDIHDAYAQLPPGLPVVHYGTIRPDRLPWIGDDIRNSGREVADYLLARGHADIALVCNAGTEKSFFDLLAMGCREAFEGSGQRWRRDRLYHAVEGESLPGLIEEILSSPARPTAILAANWIVCRDVLAVASSMRLNIPDDFSLIGMGRNVLHLAGPEITAWVPDYDEAGTRIGRLLLDAVTGKPGPDRPEFVGASIHEGRSVRTVDFNSTTSSQSDSTHRVEETLCSSV